MVQIKESGEEMEVITPTEARKNLYGIMKHVANDSTPVEISSKKNEEDSVVVISKTDWNALQETLYLQRVGVLDEIRKHEGDDSEDLGVVDWDSL